MARLSDADYRELLEFVHFAAENHGPDPFPAHVLERLRRLVPCDVVSYGDFEPERRGSRAAPRWAGEPHAPVTDAVREAFQALRAQYPHPPDDPAPILRWSDRLSRRALRRLDLYWEVGRPLGCEYELTLWLRDRETVLGGFAFDLFRHDFRDRDLEVLELLLPHLARLATRATTRWASAAQPLSRREREILDWVARGKTNPEIADTLCVAPGTVRKHLDNIYAKLGVCTRTAAISRAYGLTNGTTST
jgi:DNA-binding CsgD family transcriptional regulator